MTDRIGELTAQGVHLHASGDYVAATGALQEARRLAGGENSILYGGTMTQLAASADRQHNTDGALAFAREGYEYLDEAQHDPARSEDEQEVARAQLPAASMYVGTILTKKALMDKTSVTEGMNFLDKGWNLIKSLRKSEGIRPHQHEINMSRRVSLARSVGGRALSGIGVGIQSLVLAPFSESPLVTSHTSQRSVRERWTKDKPKAFLGGMAAISAGILGLIPSERTKNYAKKIALKTL